ncbi:MAG TPA: FAD-binding and (Fe-S)-binding domain-containing protein [Casimicrobiaceae bacterium]|nr:FAD-binding and (Fe-S)-binding domain-containing protein [Casimicrobiaceae bacterium]
MTDSPVADVAAALERDLVSTVDGEVRFDIGSRALYATDGSNYRQVPIGVVIPRTVDAAIATVAACRRHNAPILPRGGGTSLCGQCCNVAVVIDFSKYLNRIIDLDPQTKTAFVEPGCVLDTLRDAAEKHHLTFAPDPSTHSHNTLGGMIGNDSCGVHSVMGGKTVDNVFELDVLTYDGVRFTARRLDNDDERKHMLAADGPVSEIHRKLEALRDRYADEIRARFPDIPRCVSGYGLTHLLPENGFDVARALVGTEGTCVVVLGAKLRLVPSPPGRSLLVLGYPDVFSAGDHVPDILKFGPIGLEGIDDKLVSDMKAVGLHPEDVQLLPKGGGWLLVEFGGADRRESDAKARACMDALGKRDDKPTMKLFDDPAHEKMIWTVREAGLGATAHVPNKTITWEGWEDAAVAPARLGDYLRDFRKLLDRYRYAGDLYGHFGQGCVHTRIDFDLETHAGIEKFHRFLDDASSLVVSYGGSLSGEHGDGQSKAEFLPKMFGEKLVQAFGEFKAIFDPNAKMNPGKVVDPYLPTQNLRLGENYAPKQPVTFFKYPKDQGVFTRAALRCVGVGNCRQHHHQTMCPSYRVTMEEKHSTRGRSRLLFEMLRGDALKGGFRDEHVKESLDLCLACKGCRGDCPVHVDMATYKSEFLAHYYAGRLRPRSAYAFGLIDRWARLAANAPRLVNALTHAQWSAALAKRMAGVAPSRSIPRFARQSFQRRFANRTRPAGASGRSVLLWPDTFNNYYHPETALAAVEVLEAAGFSVSVPMSAVCCGRPLYDWGMLKTAQRYLRRILSRFASEIDAGTPFVVLEPACAAVFRDEMMNLFPGDETAKRLSRQTYLLAEFLAKHAPQFTPPKLSSRAIVHGHCHQKALMGMGADEALLRKLGMRYHLLDSGCCGMAGSFGFEREKVDVSVAIGELVLLPAVRAADADCLVIADGYSCREQITQCTGRRTMHLAEVCAMALAEQTRDARRAAPAPHEAVSH